MPLTPPPQGPGCAHITHACPLPPPPQDLDAQRLSLSAESQQRLDELAERHRLQLAALSQQASREQQGVEGQLRGQMEEQQRRTEEQQRRALDNLKEQHDKRLVSWGGTG